MCGSQALQPSLCKTATLKSSSDNLRSIEATVGAWSQSPECGDAATSNLALFVGVTALEVIWASWLSTTGLSQAF